MKGQVKFMTSITAEKSAERNPRFKGCFVYFIKKDGSRYAKSTWIAASGVENTPEEVIARLMKLNPGKRYEIA